MLNDSTFNFGTVTIGEITISADMQENKRARDSIKAAERDNHQKTKIDHYITDEGDLTCAALHRVLISIGEMSVDVEAAIRQAEQEMEETEQRKKRVLGDAFKYEAGEKQRVDASKLGDREDKKRRPKPTELAEMDPIASADDGKIRVYSNGYALCKASSGRDLIIWFPDCRTVRYGFNPLRNSEKEYMGDYTILVFEADTDENGDPVKVDNTEWKKDATDQPWYLAIMEIANNRDDKNSMNRGHDRKGKKVGNDDKVRTNGNDNDEVREPT